MFFWLWCFKAVSETFLSPPVSLSGLGNELFLVNMPFCQNYEAELTVLNLSFSYRKFCDRHPLGKDQNSVFCAKNNLSLVSTRNDNISRGCATKMEIYGGVGGPLCELILENPEGMGGHRKNPFRGGYRYFLELHIQKFCDRSFTWFLNCFIFLLIFMKFYHLDCLKSFCKSTLSSIFQAIEYALNLTGFFWQVLYWRRYFF